MMYPAPGIIERIGKDWDWVWLDGQHGQLGGYDTMLSMVRACDLVGRPAFVRVPDHEKGGIALAADMGAKAVIVPQVDTVEQAEALVRALKFPPLGNRSFGGRRPIDLHGRGYYRSKDVWLVCQIESPEALENADAIAALPGVDALFLGPDDLMLRWGVPLENSSDMIRLEAAIEKVATVCQRHGKASICVAAGAEATRLAFLHGVRYLVGGGDAMFLAHGSQFFRQAIAQAQETAKRPAPSAANTATAHAY